MHWNLSPWKVRNKFVWTMVPWLKIMNLKYCCIKDTYFLSLKRMEIARTSLWGFYRRKDAWRTPMTTDWEHLCGLKMIKSWRFHFSKQKQSIIGQEIWALFSYYLFQKKNFLTELSYQQLSDELPPIIYPKLTSWFRPCRNLHERSKSLFL